MLTVLTGGARAGKSSAAETLARRAGRAVTVIATAEPGDDEMAERIAAHRVARDPEWIVIEEPSDLLGAMGAASPNHTLIVDCLTLWVSNRLGADDTGLEEEAEAAARFAADRPGHTIVVTNEVGSGIVPSNPLARTYRDVLGRVNSTFVTRSDRALFVVAGRVAELQTIDSLFDD